MIAISVTLSRNEPAQGIVGFLSYFETYTGSLFRITCHLINKRWITIPRRRIQVLHERRFEPRSNRTPDK